MLVALPLLAWRLYARFRRMVGRQRLSRVRPWITLILFPTVIALLSFAAYTHYERVASLIVGVVAGSLLGAYGLRLTRFEPTPEGLYYTPNAHLGIALSLLFAARVVYRLVEVYVLKTNMPSSMDDFARSPLTLAVFGLLAGYYVAYAVGLVLWRSRVLREKQARESQARSA